MAHLTEADFEAAYGPVIKSTMNAAKAAVQGLLAKVHAEQQAKGASPEVLAVLTEGTKSYDAWHAKKHG